MKFKKLLRAKQRPDKTTSESLLKEGEIPVRIQDLAGIQNRITSLFGNSNDFFSKEVKMKDQKGSIFYLTSMTDSTLIADSIINPLTLNHSHNELPLKNKVEFEEFCKSTFVGMDFTFIDYEHEMVWHILSGYVVLLLDNIQVCVGIKINNIEHRPIQEPNAQTIIRGPKDGFTESINTNTSLIRRRIKNPLLHFESYVLGKDTKTSLSIAYIEGIVNKEILKEVRKRINEIDVSGIFDSGNIEEMIADKTFTPFPLILSSERPDAVSADLTSGKIAILVDGSPFVLIMPVVFHDFFQVSEDYFQPFLMASFLRLVRYLSFLVALLLPSLYIGLTTYHHEMIPTQLLISIAAQREGVPYPALVELLLMEMSFEILREAGIRMPRAVGQTISIVGGLVIGQAAVEAGLVSNIMVIVVALTAMASFVSPIYSFSTSTRILRFPFIIAASILGFYGIMCGLFFLLAHLTSLRSFGVPYMSPLAPMIPEDQEDTLLRFPLWKMNKRPSYLHSPAPLKSSKMKNPSPPTIEED